MAKDSTVQVTMAEDGSVQVRVRGAHEDGSDAVMVLDMAKVSATVKAYAAFHGMKQRLVDAAAMSKDTKDGSAASPATKADAIRKLVDFYATGTEKWSRVSEGGPKGGFLFEALCKVYGHMKAPSEIRAWLDGLSDKEQAALREDDTIAPVIAELKAAKPKPASTVDTKSLLAGLKPADSTPETQP